MVVNFKARGISQYTRKLTWTPILIKKKKKSMSGSNGYQLVCVIYQHFLKTWSSYFLSQLKANRLTWKRSSLFSLHYLTRVNTLFILTHLNSIHIPHVFFLYPNNQYFK
jgi:hypothetical protein